jgi:DNA-binding PadR family transcriptional regulator
MSTPVRSSPLGLTVLSLLHYQPLHPYGIQRLIRRWGKDEVVNVGQRASLYRTIERLLAGGLIRVRETGRDQQYPERTVYELTDAGRTACHDWLREMVAAPRREFPEFPAALSFVMMLAPGELTELFEQRAAALAASLATMEAADGASGAGGLPRVALLEGEYLRAVTAAELAWLRSVLADLRAGRLTWSWESLAAFAGEPEGTPEPAPVERG